MVRALCIAASLILSSEATTNDKNDYKDIICPFLSTLIHEEAIPVQDYYEKEELMAIALNAGLDQKCTLDHIHAQFRNIRSNRIDIFKLEGLPDEHYSSSGLNDCSTDYTHWDQCPNGPQGSSTQAVRVCETEPCTVPVSATPERAYLFWGHFDPDQTGYLTEQNLRRLVDGWAAFSNDINEDPGVEGKLDDAYTFLIRVFGPRNHENGGASQISYSDFNRVIHERKYPVEYEFGRGCNSKSLQNPQEDFPYYPAEPFGIQDAYGRWLALSGSIGVVVSDDKTVWTADPADLDDGYALRASGPTSYEAGSFLAVDDGALMGSQDKVTAWKAIQDKDKVVIKAVNCMDGPCNWFLSADKYGNVGMQKSASNDALFSLVYCILPGIDMNSTRLV